MRRLLAALLFVPFVAIAVTGCNDWERNTFDSLASSQAVLNAAQADYESGTIPKTGCSYSLINNGKAAQTVAVNAMVDYEQLKANKGNTAAQEAQVTADLAALVPLVAQVQSLVSNPAAACGGK